MGLRRILNQWREKVDGTLTGPALKTDELSLANPFVEKGDVVPFVSANGVAKQSVSTTNTSYQQDREFIAARLKWSDVFNPDQTLAVGLSIRVVDGTTDLRVQNATQEETIVSKSGIGQKTKVFLGFEDYEPPNRDSADIVWVEFKSSNGSGIEVADGLLYIGPRV